MSAVLVCFVLSDNYGFESCSSPMDAFAVRCRDFTRLPQLSYLGVSQARVRRGALMEHHELIGGVEDFREYSLTPLALDHVMALFGVHGLDLSGGPCGLSEV